MNSNISKERISEILIDVCASTNQNIPFLLTEEGRNKLECNLLISIESCGDLAHWVGSHDFHLPPLEVLWRLSSHNLLKLNTFTYCHPEFTNEISDLMVETVFEDKEEWAPFSNIIENMLLDSLIPFINVWNPLEGEIHPHCGEFLEEFISKVNSRMNNGCQMKFHYFRMLVYSQNIIKLQLRQYVIHHLRRLISFEVDAVSFSNAVNIQTKQFTTKTMAAGLLEFYQDIFEMISAKDILDEIVRVVNEKNFSWKFFLTALSAFVLYNNENAELIKETLDNWLKEAISTKDKMLLCISLLGFRQCCAEGVRHFSNYAAWYGSLQLKNAAAFTFFYQLLSEIVPHESALNLKIHVNKVPSAPASCQSLLIEYLTLAKTRLSYLHETTEYIGLFNTCHEYDLAGNDADISRVVEHFKETKEIPKAVFEASVFRRQYFEKTFLPRLLSVPETDDPLRAEVIHKLHSLGKIPVLLFNSWNVN